jgi:transcription initiation factor TFIID TATA-box-binding protein
MKIVNIVMTVELSSKLDFDKIIYNIDGAEISPNCVWIKYRLAPEGYYISFFRSGKILLTGAILQEKSEEIINRAVLVLKKAGINVTVKNVRTHNIVATDKFDIPIFLENLIQNLDPNKTSYEPEQFPGLIYKNWGSTFLLFNSGKIIVTGRKNVEDTRQSLKKFKQMISTFI